MEGGTEEVGVGKTRSMTGTTPELGAEAPDLVGGLDLGGSTSDVLP